MKASHLAAWLVLGSVAAAASACSAESTPVNDSRATTGGGGATSTMASVATPTTNSVATTATTGGTPTSTETTVTNTTATTTTATTTTDTTTTATGAGGASAVSTTASSTTSAAGCMATAAATGPVPITPNNGWVPCDSNTVGIEGAFFTYYDETGSTIMPANFETAGAEICVSGEVGLVDEGFTIWGAGLGFNFADEAAWDAAAQGISGVSFNISALPEGTETRIIFSDGSGTDHCATIAAAGANSFAFSDTSVDCWTAGGAMPSASSIVSVKWQVATNDVSAHPFSFCITDLQAIP